MKRTNAAGQYQTATKTRSCPQERPPAARRHMLGGTLDPCCKTEPVCRTCNRFVFVGRLGIGVLGPLVLLQQRPDRMPPALW
mmetsp:Transcript_52360/g.109096  ORF Transcript_52360/g.109096 Transcript_52360/m.109096 type:complete len:82 (-) Transcript_52360:299-544(-)